MCNEWKYVTNQVLQAQAVAPCDEMQKGLHALDSKYCKCNVRNQKIPGAPGWTLYIHQSFDRREVDQYFALRRQR
jgi:hypothetical protein